MLFPLREHQVSESPMLKIQNPLSHIGKKRRFLVLAVVLKMSKRCARDLACYKSVDSLTFYIYGRSNEPNEKVVTPSPRMPHLLDFCKCVKDGLSFRRVPRAMLKTLDVHPRINPGKRSTNLGYQRMSPWRRWMGLRYMPT